MLTADAVAWFGSAKALAGAFGMTPEAVYQWRERVPDLKQLQIEMYTEGALQAEARLKPIRTPALLDYADT